MPKSPISPDEADDHPYPEDPVHTEPLGKPGCPERVFMLDDQPRGYDDRLYSDHFEALLNEYGIKAVQDHPEHFEINDFILPEEV